MESILNINIKDYQLINLDDVYKLKDIPYSLYAIISVDRMYFREPISFDDHININFSDIYHRHQCNMNVYSSVDKLELDIISNYPCDAMTLNGNRFVASDTYVMNNKHERELKIEYIGISEKNKVCDRLSSHSTLQKIMAINMANHTNRDLYLILFNPAHFDIRTYGIDDFKDANSDSLDVVSDEAIEHFMEMFGVSYKNTDKVVALLEASLINIFKPEFNLEYKNSNSDKMFQTLEELYCHKFDKSIINIMLKEEDRGEKVVLYTDNERIELSQNNLYTVSMECPFKLIK